MAEVVARGRAPRGLVFLALAAVLASVAGCITESGHTCTQTAGDAVARIQFADPSDPIVLEEAFDDAGWDAAVDASDDSVRATRDTSDGILRARASPEPAVAVRISADEDVRSETEAREMLEPHVRPLLGALEVAVGAPGTVHYEAPPMVCG